MLISLLLLALLLNPGHEVYAGSIPIDQDVPCDAAQRAFLWTNAFDFPIYLVQWKTTPLAGQHVVGDLQWSVWHSASNTEGWLLDQDSWDHYAEPTAPHSVVTDLGSHYRTVWPGQWLTFFMRCAPRPGTSGAVAGAAFLFRFTVEQP